MNKDRVIIFIDGSNLYHGLKESFGTAKLDYQLFCNWLVGQRELVQIYYYNAPVDQISDPEGYKKQQKFFDYLKHIDRLTIKYGRLEKRKITIDDPDIARKYGKTLEYPIEKGIDVNIAVDMLKYAFQNEYDVAILLSGDGDFSSAVEEVQKLGKIVECAYVKSREAFHIRRVCNKFWEIKQEHIRK